MAEPRTVKVFDMVNAPFGFNFKPEEKANYEVEASDDLSKSKLRREMKWTEEVIKCTDLREAFYQQHTIE